MFLRSTERKKSGKTHRYFVRDTPPRVIWSFGYGASA